MTPLVIDVETTTFQKGNPYASRNKLCVVGCHDGGITDCFDIEYSGLPYGKALADIKGRIDRADLIVAFSAKFDMAWLRRYGVSLKHKNLWDVQYAHYCITGQKAVLPSLDSVLTYYGLPLKKDIVKTEYWDKKIDTPDIPLDILAEYTVHDCVSELLAAKRQWEYLKDKPQLKRLIWTGCKDLQVTQEMEWNGIKYNMDLSTAMGEKHLETIADIDKQLFSMFPFSFINWNSSYHLSSILYGGPVRYVVRERYDRVFKGGRVAEREHEVKKETQFPRLVEPLKNSKLAKEGFWSTDEGVLKKLKTSGVARKLVELVLERAKIEKKVGTYFHGFPKLYGEMDWADNVLHTNLNHVITATGRLSSNKPNVQNMEEEIRKCVMTRF